MEISFVSYSLLFIIWWVYYYRSLKNDSKLPESLVFPPIFQFFLVYHNTIMIYNTRKRRNDTIESQKERKTCFNAHFQYYRLKITGLNRMRSLKSLAMLKCESRTSLHALQYKWQPAPALMFRSCYFKNR